MAQKLHENVCVICRSHLMSEKGDDDLATVRRGIDTLIEYSVKYDDTELYEYLMSKPAVVRVHNSCRRTYTSKRKYEQFSAQRNADDDAGNPVSCKSLRSQSSLFNWKEHCLLCSAPVIKDERHPNRKDYRCVETLEIKESILSKCLVRSDSWGIEVQSRLLACNDLVAEEAVYHVQCHRKFCKMQSSEGTGRPVSSKMSY